MTPRERLMLIAPGVLFLVAFGSFELGRFAARKKADQELAAEKEKRLEEQKNELQQDDATLMRTLLAQNLEERSFGLPAVIQGATEKEVVPFDPAQPAAELILSAIRKAANEALTIHNRDSSPIRTLRRINEGSRYFEDTLRELIDADPALFCSSPLTAEGKEQRTGYPDLRIEHVESGTVAYLDPKLYEESSRNSSLRSFYYTPRVASSKVNDDAHHLLLGFAHDGMEGKWTFTKWELIDLAKLKLSLKAEFQASNRDLYHAKSQVATSGAAP